MRTHIKASECPYCVHGETIMFAYLGGGSKSETASMTKTDGFCTRPKYHKGKHVACCTIPDCKDADHVSKVWK